jgi:hypothetical protein
LEYYGPEEDEIPYEPRDDPMVQKAIIALKEHFTNKRGDAIKTPYFLTQLEVLYEDDFFPWVMKNALDILVEQKFLKSFQTARDKNKPLRDLNPIKFYTNSITFNNKTSKQRVKRKAFLISETVNSYSHPQVTAHLGKNLETLVKQELKAQHFKIRSTDSNEYNGKKWTQTNHNMDLIAEHESGRLNIGVEVKNTLGIISRYELENKIKLCHYLNLVPVFAVRWMKPYIDRVKNEHGFCWIFKTQMYPLGYENLVRKIYLKLSELNRSNSKGKKLEFPVTTRVDLPIKSVTAFEKWISLKIKKRSVGF